MKETRFQVKIKAFSGNARLFQIITMIISARFDTLIRHCKYFTFLNSFFFSFPLTNVNYRWKMHDGDNVARSQVQVKCYL